MTGESGYVDSLSDSQRGALASLREKLTLPLAASGDDNQRIVSMFGVDLTPQESDGTAQAPDLDVQKRKQDVVLLKFLRAREFDVDAAWNMLEKSMRWRHEFGADKVADDLTNPEFAADMRGFGCVFGRDREANPVTWNFYGAMDPNAELDIETFIRWRVALHETAMRMLDFSAPDGREPRISQVHDYENASMSAAGNMRAASKRIIAIFQDNYPELLAVKLFCNVPRVMSGLFAIMTAFTSGRTSRKFRMVSHGTTATAILELVEPDQCVDKFNIFASSSTSKEAAAAAAAGPSALIRKVELQAHGKETQTVDLLVPGDELHFQFWSLSSLNVTLHLSPAKAGESAARQVFHTKSSVGSSVYVIQALDGPPAAAQQSCSASLSFVSLSGAPTLLYYRTWTKSTDKRGLAALM
ncbi:Patellin-6 [Porphyridium purpureum]|uniref:Patellin-6 n=1 Tax=Porphyridium purpureum TaxID=35688 RepID=A0A5J4Z4E5_PORPP|nr:Patellin-6 [Porphyridium purpureum]|eukprot:POR4457..scf295_1